MFPPSRKSARRHSRWDGAETGTRRKAPGGTLDVSCAASMTWPVSAKAKGVVMCCNACGAGKRDALLLEGAIKAGFECGPGPVQRRRPDLSKLLPASEAALAELKRAEKRVLAFCAKQTASREWFEVSQREIVAECGGSKRDAIPLLNRLAERGLIRVRSNAYKAKRRTQIAFVVDPADLVRRFGTAETPPPKMVSPRPKMVSPWNGAEKWCHPLKNGVTMERRHVRIRELYDNLTPHPRAALVERSQSGPRDCHRPVPDRQSPPRTSQPTGPA